MLTTFSIVACDPSTGEIGVAVQSKFLSVGAVVPWVRAGAGAIATQAFANTSYAPRALQMLEAGSAPDEVAKAALGREIVRELVRVGALESGERYDDGARKALITFMHVENLENRVRDDGAIDRQTLEYLRSKGD